VEGRLAIRDSNVVALDAVTGCHLWHVQTGGNLAASPISYAVDGRQYVAIAAGNAYSRCTSCITVLPASVRCGRLACGALNRRGGIQGCFEICRSPR
jgi:hypothetical protein